MSKTKTSKLYEYKSYPPHDGYRSGCRVAWYYYRDIAKADEAAKAARYNGQIDAALGFDHGFCAPGAVTLMGDGGEYAGMYEVCIP